MLTNLLLNIIGSIVAIVIIAIFTKIYFGFAKVPGIRKAFQLQKDFFYSGGLSFFPCRAAYTRHKDHGTAENYIQKQTSTSIIYIGFYLAQSADIGNIVNTLANLANSGKDVKIVLFNPNSTHIQAIADYFCVNKDHLISCINETKNKFISAQRRSISEDKRDKLSIYFHDVPITISAFIIDGEMPKTGRILLDHKLYGMPRDCTYGLELRNNGDLYNNVLNSYMKILHEATAIK